MMRWFFPFALLLCSAAARQASDRPNVVLIFLDDSGYGDYSHNGNPTIETPAISRLANDGANFTQFYTASGACSASRFSLLTGRYPKHSGFPGWVVNPSDAAHLKASEVTIADGLKSRGYATGMFGKWHLGTPNAANGMSPDAFPLAHGFDQWIGTNVSHDYDNARLLRSDPQGDDPIPGYSGIASNLPSDKAVCDSLTGLYTDAAVSFIKANKDKPFFAYIAHNQPHLGLYVSEKFKGKSRRGLLGDVMAEIDNSVARIRQSLEESGIAENTILIFSSDNGPWIRYQDTIHDAKYGEARLRVGYAQPFRDGKGSDWEGGHRVAGIVCWPGTIQPARILEPASTLDVLPTLFAVCSVDSKPLTDGRDIRPLFDGQPLAEPFSFGYSGPDNQFSGWREGPWKLLVRTPSQIGDPSAPTASPEKPLLFQVEQDLGERIDRAAEHSEIVEKLQARMRTH